MKYYFKIQSRSNKIPVEWDQNISTVSQPIEKDDLMRLRQVAGVKFCQ
jgi:hypothetical protein